MRGGLHSNTSNITVGFVVVTKHLLVAEKSASFYLKGRMMVRGEREERGGEGAIFHPHTDAMASDGSDQSQDLRTPWSPRWIAWGPNPMHCLLGT